MSEARLGEPMELARLIEKVLLPCLVHAASKATVVAALVKHCCRYCCIAVIGSKSMCSALT